MQLWDSNSSATDEDLGFIDIGLNEVMQNPRTNGKMWVRRDKLQKLSTKGDMPCSLDWSLGYFSKRAFQPTQLNNHDAESIDDPKNNLVAGGATKKMLEARKEEPHEIGQREMQDTKVKAIALE